MRIFQFIKIIVRFLLINIQSFMAEDQRRDETRKLQLIHLRHDVRTFF